MRRGSAAGGGEARNPPLWQIQADAAPMRQRVLQASASQNDYAELLGRMALAPAGPIGGNASSTITSVAFPLIRFTAFSTFSQGEEAFIAMRFHHAWLISLIIAISHSRFSHPTIACSAASQFNPTGVHVRNRFFGTFLTQESTVSPRPPSFLPSPFDIPSSIWYNNLLCNFNQ